MPPETYVTTHIHVDGPIPGPHSLLTLTSAAHTAAGVPTAVFTTNIHELPGACPHPITLQQWRRRSEDWLSTRRASRPPAVAMNTYIRWVERLPGLPVLVPGTTESEHLFLFWYLHRFTGRWPFDRTELAEQANLDGAAYCRLAGCRHRQEPYARSS